MTEAKYAEALAALQADLPKIGKTERAKVATKDGGNYSYTYAGLATITHTIMPLLAKHGLSFVAFPTVNAAGAFVLRYTLRHVSGGSETGALMEWRTLSSAVRPFLVALRANRLLFSMLQPTS